MSLKETRRTDPELAGLIDEELARQEACVEMIASESIVPLPVMELSGSIFTNKNVRRTSRCTFPGRCRHCR